jgi:hypothetical protein
MFVPRHYSKHLIKNMETEADWQPMVFPIQFSGRSIKMAVFAAKQASKQALHL